MRNHCLWISLLVFVASTAYVEPAAAVTQLLNFDGGSLADRITDSAASSLDAGDLVILFNSPSALDAGDLFTTIFNVLPGGGVELANPGNSVLTSSIGAGISPPIDTVGRLRGSLDLGDTSSPLVSVGSFLHLVAVDASSLALATEAGISPEVFQILSLPDPSDLPPFPIDFVFGGFSTVPIPEPGTLVLTMFGLAGLGILQRRSRSRS